jgi:hypothetical protein
MAQSDSSSSLPVMQCDPSRHVFHHVVGHPQRLTILALILTKARVQ